jgi:hypothetical protein
MPSWRSANERPSRALVPPRHPCGGRLPRTSRGLEGALFACTMTTALCAQQKPPTKATAAHHANKFALASLRPGKDSGDRAMLYGKTDSSKERVDGKLPWRDICNNPSPTVELDYNGKIQELRATRLRSQQGIIIDCRRVSPGRFTGHRLRVCDAPTQVLNLCGRPKSKSPSTWGGQPLELWYYAFDWAGPTSPGYGSPWHPGTSRQAWTGG